MDNGRESVPPVNQTVEENVTHSMHFIAKNLTSLFIGIAVVIVGFAIGFSIVQKMLPFKKQHAPPAQTAQKPGLEALIRNNTPLSFWKTFQDTTFLYTVKFPPNWETFKRSGNQQAYQLGLRPIGKEDVPITINSQKNNSGISLNEYINSLFGENYPREEKKLSNKEAIVVSNNNQSYVSYYISHKNNIYELSTTTLNDEYTKVFDQLITTFSFIN